MFWTVVAALAALVAAVAALVTVWLTIGYRREERLRNLAEALIAVVSAAEDHPKHPGTVSPAADAHLREALRQLDRVVALSLLGLSAQISDPVLQLMEPSVRTDPQRVFALGTRAFERLLAEHRPRKTLRARWDDRLALRKRRATSAPDKSTDRGS